MSTTKRSIGTDFSRFAGRVILCMGLAGAATVIVAAFLYEHEIGERSAIERARLCACALAPGRTGDLSESFDRLQDRYPDLIAVAPLSPQGRVQNVLTDEPLLSQSIADFTPDPTAPTLRKIMIAGRSERIWAVTVPLNGSRDGSTWCAMIMLRDQPSGMQPYVLISCILLLALAVAMGKLLLRRWFGRHVLGALSRFAETPAGRRRPKSRVPEQWAETQAVANRIAKEAQRAQACDATVRENTYQMKKQLQQKQVRLDHQLRRAEDQATVDPLTKLRNRRFLEQELEPLLARQRARAGDLAVAMIDLDNFKTLNDTQGHKVGDELLRIVGELLRATIRPDDLAVRVGGDEFLLLFPDIGTDKAAHVAERIRSLFSQLAGKSRKFEGVSMSIGVAAAREYPTGDGQSLIDRADKALYHAKRGGKGKVCTTADRASRAPAPTPAHAT